jgi:hypothetical protein
MPIKRKFAAATAGLWLSMLTGQAVAAPAPTLTTVGQGQFSYLFWDLYQARLATASGKFIEYQQDRPVLLELTYQRDIAKVEFVDATMDQWRAQHGKLSERHQRWKMRLNELWRDVKKGDTLACLYRADGLVEFSFNGTSLGVVEDSAFGPEFLDIWLGARTTEPKLRLALLGREKNGS